MRKYLIPLLGLMLCSTAAAEEIDGEINISLVDPYRRLAPGFSGSYWPEFAQWRGLSIGAGLALHISSRFNYENTNLDTITPADTDDSTRWGKLYFNENYLEIVNFDFFAEGRWQFWGIGKQTRWRGWITVATGAIINSGAITNYQTQFRDSASYAVDIDQYTRAFKPEYRTDLYVAPGFLIGISNFIVGYRHWLFFDHFDIAKGQPPRMLGTFRLGYRFTW